jgi:hypothetical protein
MCLKFELKSHDLLEGIFLPSFSLVYYCGFSQKVKLFVAELFFKSLKLP